VWTRRGERIVPADIVAHDQRRFVFNRQWQPRLLTQTSMIEGEDLPERKFIVHRFNVRGNNPYGLGLGTILFWPVLFKREGYGFWMTFLEKYASPTPVAEVPLPKEQDELLNSLVDMVQRGAITVPLGTKLSFLEATRSAPTSYETFSRYWDEQISETVLGETLSTNIGDVGSKAAAQVHVEGKNQIIDADGDLLSDTLNGTLIQWLVDYNFPGRATPRVYRKRPTNDEAIAKAAEAVARADEARLRSMDQIAAGAAQFDTEEEMRAFIGAFETTAHLDEMVVESLVKLALQVRNSPAADPASLPPVNVPGTGETGADDGDDAEA
jgi:phage gp29-like protein